MIVAAISSKSGCLVASTTDRGKLLNRKIVPASTARPLRSQFQCFKLRRLRRKLQIWRLICTCLVVAQRKPLVGALGGLSKPNVLRTAHN